MAHLDWPYLLLGWCVMALGAAMLARALLWDRPRGRRRCPKCWYDLSGLTTLTCPECGRPHARERRLHKTRRRWLLVPVSLVVALLGDAMRLVPAARRGGWPSVVPTTALVVATPWIADHLDGSLMLRSPKLTDWRDLLYQELWGRMHLERLTRWQWWLLAEICLQSPAENSVRLECAASYGPGALLAIAADAGHLTDSQRARAERLVWFRFDCRASWPANVPIQCSMSFDRWHPQSDTRLTLQEADAARPLVVRERASGIPLHCWLNDWFPWGDGLETWPAIQSPRDSLRLVASFDKGKTGDWIPLCSRPLDLPLRIVDDVSEILHPVSAPQSAALTEDLRKAGTLRIHLENCYYLQWSPPGDALLAHGDPTFAVDIEVVHAGEVVLFGQAWWWVDSNAKRMLPSDLTSVPLYPTGQGDIGNGSGLTVRLTGDPTFALRNFKSDTYWSGQCEMAAELGPYRSAFEPVPSQHPGPLR